MTQHEFRPTNELGVFYIFSRNHEKLGYSSLIKIRSNSCPDIVAITKDGKRVGIELEYDTAGAFLHYRVPSRKEQETTERSPEFDSGKGVYIQGEWMKEGNLWRFVLNGKTRLMKEDPLNQYWYDKTTGCLLYKTVNTIGIDVVMYWERDDRFMFWEFDKEVKPVNLQDELARIQGGKRV